MNWMKENPKKSIALAVSIGLVGIVWKIGGVGAAIQLLSALLNFFA